MSERFSFYIVWVLGIVPFTLLGQPMTTYEQSIKRQAAALHQHHPETFYCALPYDIHSGKVRFAESAWLPPRRRHIVWRNAIPLKRWLHLSQCESSPCEHTGKKYSARQCCLWQSGTFQHAYGDPHLLVPVIPMMDTLVDNAVLTDQSPSEDWTELPCGYARSPDKKQLFVPPNARGRLARAYLYALEHYDLPLTPQEYRRFNQWARAFPARAWEVAWYDSANQRAPILLTKEMHHDRPH